MDGSVRRARERAGTTLLSAAAVPGAVVAMSVIAGLPAPPGLLPATALLLMAGVAARWPRAADQTLAAFLVVLLLPALVIVFAAVKLSSPGPALVRQTRYDVDGHPYRTLEFRTVTARQPEPGRPTRVGRLVRALFLGKLPVLLAAARGELPLPRLRPR